ncbi:hypothetical protein DSM112329_00601 [Paraconexibacter sp. AEG42_29]|uniref:Fenitrothion hydrolase n=1 Tax=Paraconexibacter sp. AEG42_29 TaxID=2997339 RepID=A0AAU7AQ63_9ACTN
MTAFIRRLALPALATLAAALVAAGPAQAHGLVGKQDLPIPKWLFAWAAFAVLVISFVGLATLWRTPRFAELREQATLRLPAFLEPLCGLIGILIFSGVIYAGFAGTDESAANVVPTSIYVIFWVGIPILSLLFGDVFRAFNPWRAVGRAAGWVMGRVAGDGPEPVAYPDRLGYWPAAAGIFGFAVLELAIPVTDRQDPSTLAVLGLIYAAVQLVGMALFGVKAWSDRGDAFGVYFGLFATLSPLRWTGRQLVRRPLLAGTATLVPAAGLVGLICVMIGSTSFDGFTASSLWTDTFAVPLQGRFVDAGFSREHANTLVFTGGLIAMTGVISALYLLGCAGMKSAITGGTDSTTELAKRFAPTLIPIALAYVVAHYFGLLSYQGQAMAYLLSDPLGDGSDYLGQADYRIDYTWISATAIYYVQVVALIAGHAAGLALAHDRALLSFSSVRTATRSQYWMLAVMVAFTSLALWLLSNSS